MTDVGLYRSRREFLIGVALVTASTGFGSSRLAARLRADGSTLIDCGENACPLATEVDVADTPLWIRINLAPEGLHPGLMDKTPDGRFFLVPCQDSHNLLVIDIASLRKMKVIPLKPGDSPWMAKFSPDGKYALVTLSQFVEPDLKVANLARAQTQVMSKTEVLRGATSITASPAPAPSPPPLPSSSAALIDTATWNVSKLIPVGAGPNGVEFLPDGSRAFIANSRSNTVSVVETSSWSVSKTIPVGTGPFSLTAVPSMGFLVVCNFESASLSVIDLATLATVKTISVGNPNLIQPNPEWGRGDTTWFAMGPNGKGYATNWRSNELAVVDLQTGAVIDRMPAGIENPFEVHFTPGTTHLTLASNVAKRVILLDPATKTLIDGFDTTGKDFPTGPAADHNHWINDPDNQSLMLLAPKGLGNFVVAGANGSSKTL